MHPGHHHWTAPEIALLGTMSDSVIAKKLGVSHQSVALKRRKLGIASWTRQVRMPGKWGPTELGLFRNFTDAEIAKITGRKLADVKAKREQI
ncbi:MAG TPA: hypothetical protein VMJ32_18420 [Pirellulales bacterium]|nr:hypothetical protein [Pirellulales bacterium]